VRVELTPDEPDPAAVEQFAAGKQTGTTRVEKTVPVGYGSEGLDIG
jgi:hypothetical protein